MTDHVIRTDRLALPTAAPEEMEAVIAGDRERFAALVGVETPEPFIAPPETEDVLGLFRDAVVTDPSIRPWFFRWVIDHQCGKLVGSAGFGDYPDADGVVMMGYSVYPEFEGRGYASEAARSLVAWAFEDKRVTSVRATIHPTNLASRRVAEKSGLKFQRVVETDEDGLIELWEIARPAS